MMRKVLKRKLKARVTVRTMLMEVLATTRMAQRLLLWWESSGSRRMNVLERTAVGAHMPEEERRDKERRGAERSKEDRRGQEK